MERVCLEKGLINIFNRQHFDRRELLNPLFLRLLRRARRPVTFAGYTRHAQKLLSRFVVADVLHFRDEGDFVTAAASGEAIPKPSATAVLLDAKARLFIVVKGASRRFLCRISIAKLGHHLRQRQPPFSLFNVTCDVSKRPQGCATIDAIGR
jgi:hypothetical protein